MKVSTLALATMSVTMVAMMAMAVMIAREVNSNSIDNGNGCNSGKDSKHYIIRWIKDYCINEK